MPDTITLTGLVATPPRHLVTNDGLPITTFRLASTQRRYDRGQQKWIDGDTNWFTITAFRQLASNAAASLSKGQRVVVTGRLRVRDWASDERTGTNVEVDADALGHDLSWGTAVFTRTISSAVTQGGTDPEPGVPTTGDDPDDSGDELAAARAQRSAEVALPF
jgi:single-strand DNA-binding protein